MKIWCDVCSKKKASMFCSGDEAALCDECDTRVHHANKLASKHQRFSLLKPTSSHAPLCDICQEKKAMLFCKQDRAILCIDCDVPIHTANELTQKHDRFLLNGFNLSMSGSETVADPKSQNFKAKSTVTINTPESGNSQLINSSDGGSTSRISEYLAEMSPAWQVEDLLDSSLDFDEFSKGAENDMLFVDTELESRTISYESMGLWVPQASTFLEPNANSGFHGVEGLEGEDKSWKVSRKSLDAGFIVPEISQQSTSSKKSIDFC